MAGRHSRMPNYSYKALWTGGVLVLAGLGGVYLAANYTSGTSQTVLVNLAVSVLTIGAIGLIYDIFLKQSLIADILDSSDLASTGISQISTRLGFTVDSLLEGPGDILVITPNLRKWLESADWGLIRRHIADNEASLVLCGGIWDEDDLAAISETIDSSWKERNAERSGSPDSRNRGLVAVGIFDLIGPYVVRTQTGALICIHPPGVQFGSMPLFLQFSLSRSEVWDFFGVVEDHVDMARATTLKVSGPEQWVRSTMNRLAR